MPGHVCKGGNKVVAMQAGKLPGKGLCQPRVSEPKNKFLK